MAGPLKVLRDVIFRKEEKDALRGAVDSAKLTTALFEISRAMALFTGDLTESLRQIVNAVPLIMNVSRAVLFLFDESKEHVQPVAGAGLVYLRLFRRLRLKAEGKVVDTIVRAKNPILISVQDFENDRVRNIVEKIGVKEFIAAPIVIDGEVRGFLTADTPVDGRIYTSDDMKFMSVMANLAGVAMKNAVMFEKLSWKARKLKAIYEVSRVMDATSDLDTLLKVIIDQAVELLGATSGSVILVDRKTDTLHIRAARGLPEGVDEAVKLKLGEGITGWVAKEGRPVLVGDVTKDERYVMVHEDIRSEMAVPLKWGREVFGVLNLDHTETNAFREE
ncbi:MAG: GAF domain-containing protein, partial [Deltaproteobacteria bacterium]